MRALLVTLVAGTLTAAPLAAQEPDPAPFSALTLSLRGSGGWLDSRSDASWTAGPGLGIGASTPLGPALGPVRSRLELGADLEAYRARPGAGVPDFTTLHPYLELGADLPLPLGLTVSPGLRGGAAVFRFSGEPENPTETELAAGASFRLSWALHGRWRAEAGVVRRWLLTRPGTRTSRSFLGVSRSVDPPGALRRFLAGPAGPEEPRGSADRRRQGPGSGTVLLTRGDLAASGATRLDDLLELLPGWDVTTVDGYTLRTSPGSLVPFGRQAWRLEVDGMPVETAILGVPSINRLPLVPGDLASVRAVSGPTGRGGRASDGTIRLETRRPGPGFSLRVRGLIANETGDPGPHRYTRPGRPNVHKSAFGTALRAGWCGREWSVSGTQTVQYRTHTDPIIRDRVESVVMGFPDVIQLGGTLRVERRGADGEDRLLVAGSRHRDFLFLPEVALEIPTRTLFLHAGAAGHRSLGGPLRLEYSGRLGRNTAEDHDAWGDLELDWTADEAEGEVTLAHRRDGRVLSLGVGLLRRTVRSARLGPSRDGGTASETVGTVTTRAVRSGNATSRLEARASLTASAGGDVGGEVRLGHRRAVGDEVVLDGGVSTGRRIPADDPRPWRWRVRGWEGLERLGARISGTEPGGTGRWLSLDAKAEWTPSSGSTLGIAWILRREWNATFAERRLRTIEPPDVPRLAVLLVPRVSGTVTTLALTGRTRLHPRLSFELHGSRRMILAGDATYRRVLESIRDADVRAVLDWDPAPDLGVRLSVDHRGGSRWPAFAGPGEKGSEGTAAISPELPPYTTVNVTARKWLGQRRIRVTLRVRNLLDASVRHHPAGARFGPTAYLSGELLVGGDRR